MTRVIEVILVICSLLAAMSRASEKSVDLDSLTVLIQQDSLQSYTETLQAFGNRPICENLDAQSWIHDKLASFGFDSVFTDSFSLGVFGCQDQGIWPGSVIAIKAGSTHPHHQIVIGAHFDTEPESPGADANGSGTAGVLEIARVLSDMDSRMTLVFALFDGGAWGQLGAWRYASEVARRADSVVLMVSLDRIGGDGNDNQVRLGYGEDSTYASLWKHLADSLEGIGLSGYLYSGIDPSGHFPFLYRGFEAVLVRAYYASTIAGTPSDSTNYMDFDYMTRVVKATLATVCTVAETYDFPAGLYAVYPEGVPELTLPGLPRTFLVRVEEYGGGTIIPGSGRLHYAFLPIGEFQSIALDELVSGEFEATLPPFSMYDRVRYYVSVDEATAGILRFDDNGECFEAVCAMRVDTVMHDDSEYDLSWHHFDSADGGQFENGFPARGYIAGFLMPPCDIYGHGRAWLTGYLPPEDVDNGYVQLKTYGNIDLSGGEASIEYYRWFANSNTPGTGEDVLEVHLSDDGGANWTLVKTLGPTNQASGGWYRDVIWVSDYVTPADEMKLRLTVYDLGSDSPVEAAVDHVTYMVYSADSSGPQIITTDLPDWTVGIPYSEGLESSGGVGNLIWADQNDDLIGTGLVLSSGGVVAGVPDTTGEVAFIAQVVDEFNNADSVFFTFTINQLVSIQTTALPVAEYGLPYSVQFAHVGGTGNITWSSSGADLSQYGLELGLDGLLSGTPVDTAVFTLDVQAVDEVGAFDERQFVFQIGAICGDVNFSGSGPNVSDLTYLVDYLFFEGSPPPVIEATNVDGVGGVNVADLNYLVNYLFFGGSEPVCGPIE